MKSYKQEILTYEIYKRKNNLYISIPVNNLVQPKFLIKNNSLYIFLYNYSQCYVIKKINQEVIGFIKTGNCYILENLNQENSVSHLVKLF